MLSISYTRINLTLNKVLAYAKRKRLIPAESHILSMCGPLPSCEPVILLFYRSVAFR